jgi:hypothetical protein
MFARMLKSAFSGPSYKAMLLVFDGSCRACLPHIGFIAPPPVKSTLLLGSPNRNFNSEKQPFRERSVEPFECLKYVFQIHMG